MTGFLTRVLALSLALRAGLGSYALPASDPASDPRNPLLDFSLHFDASHGNGTSVDAAVPSHPHLGNNQSFVSLATAAIHASQRAAWEQGVTVQAILEWQYPDWSTFDAPGPQAFQQGSRGGRNDYPQDVVLQALRSVVAQDVNGRLGARVTGDENPDTGSSLDCAANLESVLLAAYATGEISSPNNTLNPNGLYGAAANLQYNYVTEKVKRGANGIISQRTDQLQYWADTFYMMPPALAAQGLYTANADALNQAYTQVKLYLNVLLYPAGSGTKTGLLGHIRNDDGTWADPEVWITGQGWGALGILRVVAALGQSTPLTSTTQSQMVDLLNWAGALLNSTHALFDSSASLWHNYADNATIFHDVSGSLAVAAATYRLAVLQPKLVTPTQLQNAEAVYKRVISNLENNGQFGNGLQCVDALSFATPGYTSVEALSFGILLESARRAYSSNRQTALVKTISALPM